MQLSALVRIDRLGLVPVSMQLSTEDTLSYTKYARNSVSKFAAGLFVVASDPHDAPGVLLDYANYKSEQGTTNSAYVPIAQYKGPYGKPYNFRQNISSTTAWLEPDDDSDDCIVTQSMLAKALKKACPFNFKSTTASVTSISSIPKNTILLHRSLSNTIDGMYFSTLYD